jgi:hypothetical protein
MELPDHFPSYSAGLDLCIQFERKTQVGPAARRGSKIHEYIEKLATHKIELGCVPRSYQVQCGYALSIIGQTKGEPLLVEQTIEAQVNSFRVPCTPDYVAQTDDDTIYAVNWKSGTQRNYRMAQRFYTVAICQKFGFDRVKIVEAYVDSGHQSSYVLSLANSLSLCARMITLYLSRDEYEPARCEWCRFCAKGPTGDASCQIGSQY